MTIGELLNSTTFRFAILLADSEVINENESQSFAKSSILENNFAIDTSKGSKEQLIGAAYFLLQRPPNGDKYLVLFLDKIQKSFTKHLQQQKKVSQISFGYVAMMFMVLNDLTILYPEFSVTILKLQTDALNECISSENVFNKYFIIIFLSLFCITHKSGSLFETFCKKVQEDISVGDPEITEFVEKYASRPSALILKAFQISILKSDMILLPLGDAEKQKIDEEVNISKIIFFRNSSSQNSPNQMGLNGWIFDFCNDMKGKYELKSFQNLNFSQLSGQTNNSHTIYSYVFQKYTELKCMYESMNLQPSLWASLSSFSNINNQRQVFLYTNIDFMIINYILQRTNNNQIVKQNSELLMNYLKELDRNFKLTFSHYIPHFSIKQDKELSENSQKSAFDEVKLEDIIKFNINSMCESLARVSIESVDNFNDLNSDMLILKVSIPSMIYKYFELTFCQKAFSMISLDEESEIKQLLCKLVDDNFNSFSSNSEKSIEECFFLPILTRMILLAEEECFPAEFYSQFYQLFDKVPSYLNLLNEISFRTLDIKNSTLIQRLLEKSQKEFDKCCKSVVIGDIIKRGDLTFESEWRNIMTFIEFFNKFHYEINYDGSKKCFNFVLNIARISRFLDDTVECKDLFVSICKNFDKLELIHNFTADELYLTPHFDLETIKKGIGKYFIPKLTSLDNLTACYVTFFAFIEQSNVNYICSKQLFITFDSIKLLSASFNDSIIYQLILLVLIDIYQMPPINHSDFWEMLVYRFIELGLYIDDISFVFEKFFESGHISASRSVRRCDSLLNAFLKLFEILPINLNLYFDSNEKVIMDNDLIYPIVLPYNTSRNLKLFDELKKFFEGFFLFSSEIEYRILFTKIAYYVAKKKKVPTATLR